MESVRETFTCTVTAEDDKDVYPELVGRFRPAFREIGRVGAFADVVPGQGLRASLEVPSWAWQRKLERDSGLPCMVVDDVDDFVWPFLRDNLAVCHCLVSRTAVDHHAAVSAGPSAADLRRPARAGSTCRRRSPTTAKSSERLTLLTLRSAKPISSTSLAGVGERMILVPGLMKLGGVPINADASSTSRPVAEPKPASCSWCLQVRLRTEWEDIAMYP